jgi:hypothetical protein
MRHLLILILAVCGLGAAERINHAGRILAPTPAVTTPTLFNTAQADAVVSTLQIMPRDNPWNEDISNRPLLANSAAMMTTIRNQFSGNRQRAVLFQEMNYVLVPDTQPLANINFTLYYEDSDFNGGTSPIGRYPIPTNQPVEAWPANGEELYAYQRMTGGDRHSITVQPGVGRYFETWLATLTSNTPAWEASNGAIFDLTSNAIRTPDGIGSGDAAGLPMFPALVRYDEIQRGVVEHALRLIVAHTRDDHIYPATHDASVPRTTDPNVPAMGQRLRLKSSFAIPATWTPAERAVAVALKKYGAIMADNGNFFSMSICPDDRWAPGTWDHFQTGAATDFLDISNFEVIQTTGPSEGPRSAGAPTVAAGADQNVALAVGATLSASATGTGLSHLWSLYDAAHAPGTATFANPTALATTVTFSAAGSYTLMIRSSDAVHTPAYDAVVITVTTVPAGTPPVLGSASATPSSVTGTTTSLAVSASDDGGEATLTYTWQATGPGTVLFSPNASNAAKVATATFPAPGSYTLTVTVTDAGNQTVQGTVPVSVVRTATTLVISPGTTTLEPGQSQLFTAIERDQFGAGMPGPVVATWSVNGGGSIAGDGVFQAGSVTGGPYTVTAQSPPRSANAALVIQTSGSTSRSSETGAGGGCGAGAMALLLSLGLVGLLLRD